MKKLFLLILFIVPAMFAGLPTVSPEQQERNAIAMGIQRIMGQFSGCALSSPSLQMAVKQYLQNLGTPVSYKVYQEMVANRELR